MLEYVWTIKVTLTLTFISNIEEINNSLQEKRRRMEIFCEAISEESSYTMKQTWKIKEEQM